MHGTFFMRMGFINTDKAQDWGRDSGRLAPWNSKKIMGLDNIHPSLPGDEALVIFFLRGLVYLTVLVPSMLSLSCASIIYEK